MGAGLESIFMGISAIGGSVPADAAVASVVAVAFTVLTGASMEAGLALALPIGTAMAAFAAMFTPLWGSLAPYWEKLAVADRERDLFIQTLLVSLLETAIAGAVLFVAVAYGVQGLNDFLASMPAWVMRGLGAASGMMLAVGFAILTSMIWSNEVGVFFFLGFVMVKFLNLSVVPIAVIGVVIAVTIFLIDKQIIDLKQARAALPADGSSAVGGEEDFFA
jgi:PTS system mannose-specific IIC component/fructoselysine and glucoselysine-specific PTS system IIC component